MSKTFDIGISTAYGAAVRGGYAGTYEQFCADLARLADVLEEFLGFSVTIQTLAEGQQATASYENGVLSLGIPKGDTGNGIRSISLLSTVGLVKTYRITYTSGNYFDFPVADGKGIQSTVLNSDYTLTITYTDGTTWTSESIRGQVGATPHLTIGTVKTLPPSKSASATITGTDENPVLNLEIPKGDTGEVSQSEFDALSDDVGDLTRQLSDVESAVIADINTQSIWANGGIASATGVVTKSTTRLVSQELPQSATKIIPASGYKYIIAAYDDDGYVGMWNGNSLPKSATWLTVATDLKPIGDYIFRLVLAKTNDTAIDTDVYSALQIAEFSDSTLKMRCFPADASAVGKKILSIDNTLNSISENAKLVFLGLHEYVFPTSFDMESPVHVYTDGCNYITDFNDDDYKNTGGITYYVGHNGYGASTNPSVPGSYSAALRAASDGDTIIIQQGVYTRDDPAYAAPNPITKSVNIIAPDGAVFLDGNYMTYTKTQGYTHVYDTDRTLTSRIIDTSISGKFIPYKAVATIQEVDETPGSYYFDTPKVYVHSIDNSNPTGKVINCLNYEKFLDINNSNGGIKVYIEGITLVGKLNGILIDRTVPGNDLNVCFNNVTAILCGNEETEKDSFMVYGGNVIFSDCKALSSYKDGYNYSGRNYAGDACICECTEINCIGAGVGHDASNAVQNATTAHQRAKVIRINGKYYDSNGGNVADVQSETQSVNIGCIAFSPFTTGGYSQNFTLQQSGAEMWLEGCIATGAKYDIFCINDATIHANNTAYDTTSIYHDGTFEETNKQTVIGLALKRGLLFGIT